MAECVECVRSSLPRIQTQGTDARAPLKLFKDCLAQLFIGLWRSPGPADLLAGPVEENLFRGCVANPLANADGQ